MAKGPLRYQGDTTSLRLGGVYVKADGVSQQDVVTATKRFWASAGGHEEPGAHVTGAEFKTQGLLGVAVLPAAPDIDGAAWIGVYDSARYAQGWLTELASALHHYLSVPTFSFYIGPKTRLVSNGTGKYVGLARKSTGSWERTLREADRFPFPFFDGSKHQELAPAEGAIEWLRFRIAVDALDRKLEFEKNFWK